MLDVNKTPTNSYRDKELYSLPSDPEEVYYREQKRLAEIQNTITDIGNTHIPTRKATTRIINESNFVLPDHNSFSQFYAELSEYAFAFSGCQSVSWDGDTLRLRAMSVEIAVSVPAIVELLANKFAEVPLIKSTEKVTGAPPFIEDMDNRVYNKIQMIKSEFNHILALGNPRIEKLCHDYYRTMSYPLHTRIKYMEWERSLMGFKIQQIMEKGDMDYASKEKQIRQDYNRKMHEELSKKERILTDLKTDNQRARTIAEHANSRLQQYKDEAQQLQGEIETLHNKNKALEDGNQKNEVELASLKTKNSELDKKYNALETKYQALVDRMTERPQGKAKIQQDTEEISEGGKGLAPTQQKIVEFLDGKEPQTVSEIVEGTGIAKNHVQTHLISLLEAGLITKEEDTIAGESVYSLFIPS